MDSRLKQYLSHKSISIGTVLAVTAISFLMFPNEEMSRWYVLLLTLTVFGYSHYVVGGFYQLSSFTRKRKIVRHYVVFAALALVSAGMCYMFIRAGNSNLLAFIVIGYFILHGFLNEITLFERQTGRHANRMTLAALVLVILALTTSAVGHASWFFTPDLKFIELTGAAIQSYLTNDPIPQTARIIAATAMVAAFILQLTVCARSSKEYRIAHFVILVTFVAAGLLIVWWYPLHYIFVLAALLLYHFVVWFLFYFTHFQSHMPERLPQYLWLHAIVIVPFIFLVFPGPLGEFVDTYILNSYTFLTLTAIHISVSFMSEPWFRQVVLKE